MIYLELDDVLAIACEVLGLEVDALVHVTDLGLADSAVARPRASFTGEEFHPTVEAKAASLLFGLARNHAFIAGNKRVALCATRRSQSFRTKRKESQALTAPGRLYSSTRVATSRSDSDIRYRRCLRTGISSPK